MANNLHPLIRDLKSDLASLRSSCKGQDPPRKVKDSNNSVVHFCQTLELALKHGMIHEEEEFFTLVQSLARDKSKRDQGLNGLVKHIVEEVSKIKVKLTFYR